MLRIPSVSIMTVNPLDRHPGYLQVKYAVSPEKLHVHTVAKMIPPSCHVASVSIVKANPLDTQRY